MAKKRKAIVGKDCVACGNCTKYCPVGAITIWNGLHAVVAENTCVGCGKCAKVCPAEVIEMVTKEVQTDEKALV